MLAVRGLNICGCIDDMQPTTSRICKRCGLQYSMLDLKVFLNRQKETTMSKMPAPTDTKSLMQSAANKAQVTESAADRITDSLNDMGYKLVKMSEEEAKAAKEATVVKNQMRVQPEQMGDAKVAEAVAAIKPDTPIK